MNENRNRIINSDDSEKLIKKAEKVMLDYKHATGSSICIYDSAYKPYFSGNADFLPESNICPGCYFHKPGQQPCHEIHVKAIEEAAKKGS